MKTFSFGLLLKRFRMNRFQVLLPITLMVVIVPAFLPNGLFFAIIFLFFTQCFVYPKHARCDRITFKKNNQKVFNRVFYDCNYLA